MEWECKNGINDAGFVVFLAISKITQKLSNSVTPTVLCNLIKITIIKLKRNKYQTRCQQKNSSQVCCQTNFLQSAACQDFSWMIAMDFYVRRKEERSEDDCLQKSDSIFLPLALDIMHKVFWTFTAATDCESQSLPVIMIGDQWEEWEQDVLWDEKYLRPDSFSKSQSFLIITAKSKKRGILNFLGR